MSTLCLRENKSLDSLYALRISDKSVLENSLWDQPNMRRPTVVEEIDVGEWVGRRLTKNENISSDMKNGFLIRTTAVAEIGAEVREVMDRLTTRQSPAVSEIDIGEMTTYEINQQQADQQ